MKRKKRVVRKRKAVSKKKSAENIAFVDGQNLHLGTSWNIDYKRFRTYLQEKYGVREAYYFFGYESEEQRDLYDSLQKAGFSVVFKEHEEFLTGKKKGNVDTDIVFEVMRSVAEDKFKKVVLVSGDGDYKKMVDYLIQKSRFEKMLFPNWKFASSLYKKIGSEFFDHLDKKTVRRKIEYHVKKKKAP